MADEASDFVDNLLGHATALLAGDPTNEPHMKRTREELNKALGTEGRADLLDAVAEGDLLATVYRLGKAMVAMGEADDKALHFAAQVAPQHRLPEHMKGARAPRACSRPPRTRCGRATRKTPGLTRSP